MESGSRDAEGGGVRMAGELELVFGGFKGEIGVGGEEEGGGEDKGLLKARKKLSMKGGVGFLEIN